MSDYHDDSRHLPEDCGGDRSAHWQDDRTSLAPVDGARSRDAHRARAPFDLARFAEWLPRLGAVLWLDRRERRGAAMRAAVGAHGVLLLDHPALGALAHCIAATAHTQVTPQGPREWLSFRDADGDAQAKLFLLPDTDYLAWDEMTAASDLAPATAEPLRWHAHTAFLRTAFARLGSNWRARLLTFDHRRLPWLHTLGAQPPLRISLLGLDLARAIARSEGAELTSPLHIT
jgi:putative heme degradation protein